MKLVYKLHIVLIVMTMQATLHSQINVIDDQPENKSQSKNCVSTIKDSIQMDPIDIAYNRRYRTSLIQDDYQLIALIADSLKNNNCSNFVDIFTSKDYSGAFLKELASSLLCNDLLCIEEMLQNLNIKTLFFEGYTGRDVWLFGIKSYPISYAIKDNVKYTKLVKEYLLSTSEVLNDGQLIFKYAPSSIFYGGSPLLLLGYLLSYGDLDYQQKDVTNINSMRMANILWLVNFYKENGYKN